MNAVLRIICSVSAVIFLFGGVFLYVFEDDPVGMVLLVLAALNAYVVFRPGDARKENRK